MFPPEIFTEIFGFLTSEAPALTACSQAHPIFAQLIEPILYAHVIVHDHYAVREDQHHLKLKPCQLSTLLSDKPRILNYLRSLHVNFSLDECLKEIAAILGGLKLERIQLTGTFDCVSWERLPIAFRTAFVACISTSYMKEICLDGVWNMPLSSFADCAGLKRLGLWYYAVPPSNISCNFPHLEVLELFDWNNNAHSQDFSSWALTHACGLRSLTLTTSIKNIIQGFLPSLLAICSTSLVNLSIYYTNALHPSHDIVPVEIDFPSLPNLERLRLCTYTASFNDPDDYVVYRALIVTTQILRNLSPLKHLTLIICIQFRGEDITHVDWCPLADFLSDRRSSFQHTDLYIRAVKTGGEVFSDEVVSMLSRYENLMSLVEAGYVSIKEEKYSDVHVNRFFKF